MDRRQETADSTDCWPIISGLQAVSPVAVTTALMRSIDAPLHWNPKKGMRSVKFGDVEEKLMHGAKRYRWRWWEAKTVTSCLSPDAGRWISDREPVPSKSSREAAEKTNKMRGAMTYVEHRWRCPPQWDIEDHTRTWNYFGCRSYVAVRRYIRCRTYLPRRSPCLWSFREADLQMKFNIRNRCLM